MAYTTFPIGLKPKSSPSPPAGPETGPRNVPVPWDPSYYTTKGAGAGGVQEAPSDGQFYARQNGVWVPVPDAASTNVIRFVDDFDQVDIASGSQTFARASSWIGTATPVEMGDANHWGVWKIVPATSIKWAWYTGSVAVNTFNPLSKAIFRVVLKVDNTPETGTYEWYVGFYDKSTYTTNNPCGALLSCAQGYTGLPLANGLPGNVDASKGIIAGTYDGLGATGPQHLGYLQSGYQPVINGWMELIAVWTPTQCRFYLADETATSIPLVATITTTIPLNMMPIPNITNNSNVTNLFVDRAELELYVNPLANAPRFKESGLDSL